MVLNVQNPFRQRCQEILNDIEFIAKEAEDVCQQHNYVHETDRMRCHKTGEICQRAVRLCESRNGLVEML